VVGVCAGVAALGLDRLVSSPIALGGGYVRTAHGRLPVPGPAVLALLADAAAPGHGGGVEEELATPTGVALVTALASDFGQLPPMRPAGTGTGAGARDPADRPNVVRLVVGEALAADRPHQVVVLEANVDDLDPRAWPVVLADLLAAGALDAWLTPVLMKKGRPAHVVSALAEPVAVPAVRAALFRETTTLGVRESVVARQVLARRLHTVDVGGQPVAVKLGLGPDGEVVNAMPEWEDVVRAAGALDRPVKSVLAQAMGLAEALPTGAGSRAD
jgi:pyridinium-3,5-bisthiocarboxylic acid mononucleotide nickel chelatase